MNAELKHIHSQIHSELGAAVDQTTYSLWLEPLWVESASRDAVIFSAPTQTREWVQQRYGVLLATAAAAVLGGRPAVQVAVRGSASVHAGGSPQDRQQAQGVGGTPGQGRVVAQGAPTELRPNPQLTFDRFVIGESNRLAHGASLSLAEAPGASFNPLFICGPPGVGKTHLLHAIASFVSAHNTSTVVRLTASEPFTNEFLSALRDGSTERFKARFRHVDVLLVDDIQFLQRKARTEEEFFHTFNNLYSIGSQIVVTSDRPPRDLGGLEDRLRERFEAGLVADIRPPDLTTRVAILRKKLADQSVASVDASVVQLIAEHVSSSVRALEGALVRIVAFASLTQRPVTEELAGKVLRGLYGGTQRPVTKPTLAAIQSATCRHFKVSSEELLSASRAREVVWPRQVAMYLARELTSESLPSIGRSFGGRDHSTVLYACRRARDRVERDPQARQAEQALRSLLTGPDSPPTPPTPGN